MKDISSTQTQLKAKPWAQAHLYSSPWLLPPPFRHISVFPLLSLSTANPRTENWTASFLLPLSFSQPPPPALPSLLIAAASQYWGKSGLCLPWWGVEDTRGSSASPRLLPFPTHGGRSRERAMAPLSIPYTSRNQRPCPGTKTQS